MLIYLEMIESEEDRTKFEQIYDIYQNLMFHVANHILCHEQDAEDAVHHAFLKIIDHMDKIESPTSPRTKSYVAIITESCAIDLLRRRRRTAVIPLEEETVGITAAYDGTDQLAQSILALPTRYRQVILLKYFHGYSLREIASMMGITYVAAVKLEQRAKKRLHGLYYSGVNDDDNR